MISQAHFFCAARNEFLALMLLTSFVCMCVCVCVCKKLSWPLDVPTSGRVCVRERERKCVRERERMCCVVMVVLCVWEREREGKRELVSIVWLRYVYVSVCVSVRAVVRVRVCVCLCLCVCVFVCVYGGVCA